MTGRFTLSPRAQADLSDIWDYTVDRWGVDQAETYTRALWPSIEAVAANPAMGEDCSVIRSGYRMMPSGSHILFIGSSSYKQLSHGVHLKDDDAYLFWGVSETITRQLLKNCAATP